MNKNKSSKKASGKIPLTSYILVGFALASALILTVSRLSPDFADYFNRYVGGATRASLAFITNLFPFSVAELLVFLLPIFIILIIIYGINSRSDTLRALFSYFTIILSGASLIFTLFVFSFGTGYHTPSLYDRFDIDNDGIDAVKLEQTAEKLVYEINRRTVSIAYDSNGASVMPYSLDKMNDIMCNALKTVGENYDFLQIFKSNIKPVLLSVPMSYTHTTGIYTFFTGEANLNVDFPDYTLPYTTAHELAHQRGIARENEANFIAFLACSCSEDVYIEYCAYINMFEYVAVALYNTDHNAYKRVYDSLSNEAKGELEAYSQFYNKYRNSKAGEISSAINDAYLIANGNSEGTKSYGLVVDLAVAYFDNKFGEK